MSGIKEEDVETLRNGLTSRSHIQMYVWTFRQFAPSATERTCNADLQTAPSRSPVVSCPPLFSLLNADLIANGFVKNLVRGTSEVFLLYFRGHRLSLIFLVARK